MNNEAIVIGYSGHAYVVLDILMANGYNVMGYCEQFEVASNPFMLNYIGHESNEEVRNGLKRYDVFIAIGKNSIRENIFKNLLADKFRLPWVKHPSAITSPSATINDGSVIMPGAVLNALSTLGVGVICNSASIIEHECKIGDFSHIGPGAVLAGNVSVGKGSFIGANAVIKQGITIGENVVIGAGAVVVKDVKSGSIVYGNPAKKNIL